MQPDQTMVTETTPFEPIVAVFDSKIMALRAVDALRAADFNDIWLSIVRGEGDDGKTLVACEGADEIVLAQALIERGSLAESAHRFDGILPPSSAVMSLRVHSNAERAAFLIEVAGGHIDH